MNALVVESAGFALHALEARKPDGRAITLYGREPVGLQGPVPSPGPAPSEPPAPHLRWHPFRAEWVLYAAHRQERTFEPRPGAYNPLAPSGPHDAPTELPPGVYDVAVFDNRFPALAAVPGSPPPAAVPTLPAVGHCEVVVFGQRADKPLSSQSVAQLEVLLAVWGHRTRLLGTRPGVEYVLPFENRGVEMGVTLHHPHGQIYAYPFVPPLPAAMLAREREHYYRRGRTLLESVIADERRRPERVLHASDEAICFVPAWARYPYEIWIAPTRPHGTLDTLDDESRRELATALSTALRKLDRLWNRPCPYLMVWYQAPMDGRPHPESHLRAEIWPVLRAADRVKYLAGTELGAGLYTNDLVPERTARELQQVEVDVP